MARKGKRESEAAERAGITRLGLGDEQPHTSSDLSRRKFLKTSSVALSALFAVPTLEAFSKIVNAQDVKLPHVPLPDHVKEGIVEWEMKATVAEDLAKHYEEAYKIMHKQHQEFKEMDRYKSQTGRDSTHRGRNRNPGAGNTNTNRAIRIAIGAAEGVLYRYRYTRGIADRIGEIADDFRREALADSYQARANENADDAADRIDESRALALALSEAQRLMERARAKANIIRGQANAGIGEILHDYPKALTAYLADEWGYNRAVANNNRTQAIEIAGKINRYVESARLSAKTELPRLLNAVRKDYEEERALKERQENEKRTNPRGDSGDSTRGRSWLDKAVSPPDGNERQR